MLNIPPSAGVELEPAHAPEATRTALIPGLCVRRSDGAEALRDGAPEMVPR